jgi:hypothetical protein
MANYRVSFYKTLLSSNGLLFNCLQQQIDVRDSENAAQAAESGLRAFKAARRLRDWKLHADVIEVLRTNPAGTADGITSQG